MTSDGLRGRTPDEDDTPLVKRFDVPNKGTVVASASRAQVAAMILELMALFGTSSDDDDATLVIVANEDAPATLREGCAF
jgi:hypothetical protein